MTSYWSISPAKRWGIVSMLGCLSIATPARAQVSHSSQPRAGVERAIKVPFLYENPARGTFILQYEIGRKFDASKPTVLVIADGQQFYVRKGLIAPLQDELFGDRFNVVGIFGRGANEGMKEELLRSDTSLDWLRTYELLKSEEWVNDIEAVRKDVVGVHGTVLLYGRSGGGLLVHQYLARYPGHVRRVFTQAPVNRFVDAEFGLNSDDFWNEIGAVDKELQSLLLEVLERHHDEHDKIMLLLQRQNFFVPANKIGIERSRLIHVLGNWDENEIAALTKQYQVDGILSSLETRDPATSVRLFELSAPVLSHERRAIQDRISPDIEVGMTFGAPLISLLNKGEIKMPSMDLEALYRVSAEVYIMAGRFDHTADYRSQMVLAAHYPKHRLLLLTDDHDFLELNKTGLYPLLLQSALAEGIHGPQRQGIESRLEFLIYDEQ
jgi:pimeloyl-ACP methyl ester carboxylesterase